MKRKKAGCRYCEGAAMVHDEKQSTNENQINETSTTAESAAATASTSRTTTNRALWKRRMIERVKSMAAPSASSRTQTLPHPSANCRTCLLEAYSAFDTTPFEAAVRAYRATARVMR